MKDFIGKELNVGDSIIFIAPGYRTLVKGVITSFIHQKVYVEYYNRNYNVPQIQRILQEPFQLIKTEL